LRLRKSWLVPRMGKLNTIDQQERTLTWAEHYKPSPCFGIEEPTLKNIRELFYDDLVRYFALAGLSRSKSAPAGIVLGAYRQVFRVRVGLERSISESVRTHFQRKAGPMAGIFQGSFFGASKKQGVSVRFALAGCIPSRLCGAACYAHDVLDASPRAVVRGAVNDAIARLYEENEAGRKAILDHLIPHTKKAVITAIRECQELQAGWSRAPRIRFAHVGEAAAYPEFANALARQVADLSSGRVVCVAYTRHPRAIELDPELFVVNFTLDEASEARRGWIPPGARAVYSAFGGRVSSTVEVNFLEHHRWVHMSPVGSGPICPSTLPEVDTRSCDGVQCSLCFSRPSGELNPGRE